MIDQTNNELINGTRRTSFLLGLTSGVAGTSVLALVGLFVLLFAGQVQGIKSPTGAAANNVNTVVDTNQGGGEVVAPAADLPAITSDDHVKGPENAKVTLVEYSDFECPYCLNHKATVDQVVENYGDDVRVVFRHFPLSFHPEAEKAAEASECAAEQGKFWEMHDKIFAANEAGTMSVNKWKEEAKKLANKQ